jgi:SAM-dependent methyltransferase
MKEETTIMSSLFTSILQTQHYALSRPKYPIALYERIASKFHHSIDEERSVTSSSSSSDHHRIGDLAVDVGCGTGQVSIPLADYFSRVVAIDPSQAQLQEAVKHDKVSYKLGDATMIPVNDGVVDLVATAQAAHWFDMEQFYTEVDRVLKPGSGVCAIWTYGNMTFPKNPDLQHRVMGEFYNRLLKEGNYWDSRRQLVDDRYTSLPLLGNERGYDTERIDEGLDIHSTMTRDELLGYLQSWSGYVTYLERNTIQQSSKEDPIEDIRQWLDSHYVSQSNFQVIWPVTLILSTKREQ